MDGNSSKAQSVLDVGPRREDGFSLQLKGNYRVQWHAGLAYSTQR